MTTPVPPTLDASTRLAVDRTRLGYERTMMAWVRTATSLISFGFAIYKFFQFQSGHDAVAQSRLIEPREFALIMIGTGLVALLLADVEHRGSLKRLRAEYGPQPRSMAGVVGAIVAVIGLAAFAAALFRG